MKRCDFCGFVPSDNRGILDWKHVYCIHCKEIVHFNLSLPDGHVGFCKCGLAVSERPDGYTVWRRGKNMVWVFRPDEQFSKKAISKEYEKSL